MSKFVLIDPSIAWRGGHYLEYAKRVLHAAGQLGFAPILATNQAFDAGDVREWSYPVDRVFRFDIWGHDPSRIENSIAPPTAPEKVALRRVFSRSGLAWSIANADRDMLEYIRETGLPSKLLKLTLRLSEICQGVNAEVEALKTGDRMTTPLEEAMATRQVVSAILQREATRASEFAATPSTVRDQLLEASRATHLAESFRHSLASLMQRHRLGKADVIFMPTMSWTDLRGLSSLLATVSPEACPLFVPLFRRNIFQSYPVEYTDFGYAVHKYRHLFASLREDLASRIRICTDTEPLTEQYREVSPHAVTTLPIPCPTSPIRQRRRAAGAPLCLAYLGDARSEKGFDVLPLIATATMDEPLRGHIRLLSQYYFPSRFDDARMMRAGELLRLHAPHRAELIEGALDSTAYAELIDRADAMLIAYDRSNYAARSSGIFIEALCAGVPVITTAGTWMSGVIDKLTVEYHTAAIRPQEILEDFAGESIEWRAYQHHSGEDLPEPGLTSNEVVVQPGRTIYFRANAPQHGASHVWLTFASTPEARGQHIAVTASIRGLYDCVLEERTVVLGGSSSDQFSLVLPTPRGTKWVWIGFSTPFTDRPQPRQDIRLRWLRRESPIARCAAGVTTLTLSGAPHSDLLEAAIPELIRDFDEIARTAARVAPRFASEHQASTLVRRIVEEPPSAAPARQMRAFRWR